MTIKKSIYKSEGDRMRKLEAEWFASFSQLEIWLEEDAENFGEQEISNITRFLLSSFEHPAFGTLLQDRRVLARVSYTRTSRVLDLRFRFVFNPNVFTISKAIAIQTLQSAADAVMAADLLASSVANQLQRLTASMEEQIWEIRTAINRSYLIIKQGDRRIRLDEASFTVTQPFDRPATVLIALDVHCGRVSELHGDIVVDGVVLQAEVTRVRIASYGYDYCYIELNPRINRIEFSEDSDTDLFSLSNPRGDRVVRIWTNQEMRSPTPTRRALQRTAEDGSEIRQSAEVIQSDAEHEQHIRALLSLASQRDLRGYTGDITCRHNAKSYFLRCAVNPCGPCEGCADYRNNLDESN